MKKAIVITSDIMIDNKTARPSRNKYTFAKDWFFTSLAVALSKISDNISLVGLVLSGVSQINDIINGDDFAKMIYSTSFKKVFNDRIYHLRDNVGNIKNSSLSNWDSCLLTNDLDVESTIAEFKDGTIAQLEYFDLQNDDNDSISNYITNIITFANKLGADIIIDACPRIATFYNQLADTKIGNFYKSGLMYFSFCSTLPSKNNGTWMLLSRSNLENIMSNTKIFFSVDHLDFFIEFLNAMLEESNIIDFSCSMMLPKNIYEKTLVDLSKSTVKKLNYDVMLKGQVIPVLNGKLTSIYDCYVDDKSVFPTAIITLQLNCARKYKPEEAKEVIKNLVKKNEYIKFDDSMFSFVNDDTTCLSVMWALSDVKNQTSTSGQETTTISLSCGVNVIRTLYAFSKEMIDAICSRIA